MSNVNEMEVTLRASIALEQAAKGKVLTPDDVMMVRQYLDWCVLPGTPLRAALYGVLESYESLRTEKLLVEIVPESI